MTYLTSSLIRSPRVTRESKRINSQTHNLCLYSLYVYIRINSAHLYMDTQNSYKVGSFGVFETMSFDPIVR